MLFPLGRPFTKRTRKATRLERRLKNELAEVERKTAALSASLQKYEEEMRQLQSKNRIQQVEIDELTAVIARNLERVKSETRDLAHRAPRLGGLNSPTFSPQEIEHNA